MAEEQAQKSQSPRQSQQHLAPDTSPEHRDLRKAAEEAGQDVETLRNLLWLINAHDRLLGLRQIADNLLQILNSRKQGNDLAIFRGWPEVLRWIVEFHKGSESSKDPIRNYGLQRHPLYDCLWHRSNGWVERYVALQWHLLWAHASYLYKESRRSQYEAYGEDEEWAAFPNSPYVATLSVRELAKDGWGPLLEILPVVLSPTEFAKALSGVHCPRQVEGALKDDWPGRRADLQSFLAKANGLTPWGHGPGGNGVSFKRYKKRKLWSTDATPGDPDDPDAHWPSARWITVPGPGLDRKRTQELLKLDLDPDEIVEPEHRYLVEPEHPDQDRQQLAVQSALAARGQCRHVQMAHQLLPWQYNQLSLQELAWCLHQCSKAVRELQKLTEWTEEQYLTVELVALIHVMLWTGSSFERAYNLRVLTGEPISEANFLFELDKSQWRIPAARPKYKSEITDPMKQTYPTADSFLLPDIAQTKSFIRQLRDRCPPPPISEPLEMKARRLEGHLFLASEEYYRNALKQWLRGRGRANDLTGRVTIGRISSFLFNRLMATTGDVMAAVLVTGHSHPQARTQQYYAFYSVTQLRKIYLEATATVVQEAYKAASLDPPALPVDSEAVQEGHVGARLCVTRAAAKDAVRRLQEQLGAAAEIKDRAGSITFHNLYTLYTVLLFAYATSMRAIRTPYLSLEEVDTATGFAFISDKDDDAQHKARLAWVPTLVIQQMEAYADHLDALSSDHPWVRDWVRRVPKEKSEKNSKKASKKESEKVRNRRKPCFFLDPEKGKPLEVRPTTLCEHMQPYLALPPNVHRRFMRHELLGAGCPPEVVNAWLGHAFQGEEPWGPHSSFSFAEYRTTLEHYLEPILEELGWRTWTSPLS